MSFGVKKQNLGEVISINPKSDNKKSDVKIFLLDYRKKKKFLTNELRLLSLVIKKTRSKSYTKVLGWL